MKYRTTKTAVTNGYGKRIEVGYCAMQSLLRFRNPVAYTCGVYGWNADIYEIDGFTCIVTGYRPFGNYSIDYDVLRELEKQADKHGWSDDNRQRVEALLMEAIEKAQPKKRR